MLGAPSPSLLELQLMENYLSLQAHNALTLTLQNNITWVLIYGIFQIKQQLRSLFSVHFDDMTDPCEEAIRVLVVAVTYLRFFSAAKLLEHHIRVFNFPLHSYRERSKQSHYWCHLYPLKFA